MPEALHEAALSVSRPFIRRYASVNFIGTNSFVNRGSKRDIERIADMAKYADPSTVLK